MMKKEQEQRQAVEMYCTDMLVPPNHLLRKIDAAVNFDHIYDIVSDLYSHDTGRPSIDPVVLFKLVIIQHLYGIRSLRQTVKDVEVNVAYRWFIGYTMTQSIPHFAPISYAFSKRFTPEVIEQVFNWILNEANEAGYLEPEVVFVDSTHIKANANVKKRVKKQIPKAARQYEEQLMEEVNQNREAHGKKPFDDDPSKPPEEKTICESTTDPESGLFHKGEHKKCFAYGAHTGCDKSNFILGYITAPGNVHDSTVFDVLYRKITNHFPEIKVVVADAGYKTPWICKLIFDDGRIASLPYKRPMTKRGNLPGHEIGMINTSGQIVIEPIACSYMGYMTVENGFTELRDETVMYQDMQHQWGFYSLEGDLISKAQWDDTYDFVNGFAYVKKNGLWNILDKQGRLILDNWWDSIDIGSKGAATLWSSEKGIDVDSQGQIYATYEIDADGNWHQLTYGTQSIVPYEQMYDLKEQLCAYRLNDLYGIMNSNGTIVTEPLWEDISTFAPDGLLSVYKDSLWGWGDREGNYILDLQWKTIYQVKENRWIGQYENGESWIFDDQGQMICMIGNNLVYTVPYEDGYIEYATNNGYWGFLDSDGNLLSKVNENEIKQVSLADYSERWIQVELNDQQLAIMYVDGTIMSSEKWTAISPFYNGYAVVRIGGNEGYIDKFGNLIHPAIWKDCGAYSFVNGQLIAPVTSYSSEQRSYIDENGRTICGVKVQ